MALFDNFPYTNTHEMNLDWILERTEKVLKSADEIAANTEIAQEAAENASQSLAQIYETFTTPEMFGAIGDGVADDSDAVQKALDTGKSVKFSKSYNIEKQIKALYGNIVLYGSGTLILNCIETEEFTVLFSGNNIVLNNINFVIPTYTALNNTASRNGVKFSDCSNVLINNCTFTANATACNGILDFYESWHDVKITNCKFDINTFYNNTVHAGGVWIRAFNNEECYNINIDNCVFNSVSADEVLAVWNANAVILKNVIITNCIFSGTSMPYLITLASCDNIIFANCQLSGTPNTAFIKCYYNSITNNALSLDNLVFLTTANTYVVYTTSGQKVTLKNSIIKGNSARATRVIFHNCNIELLDNSGQFNTCEFDSCNLTVSQSSNQFLRGSVLITDSTINSSGTMVQTLSDDAVVKILNSWITHSAGQIFSGRRGVQFIIKNNIFQGAVMPNFGSFLTTDVVMNNLFASSPSYPASRPIGADSSANTNLVG